MDDVNEPKKKDDITYHPFIECIDRIHFPPLQDMFKIETSIPLANAEPSSIVLTTVSSINNNISSTLSSAEGGLTTSSRCFSTIRNNNTNNDYEDNIHVSESKTSPLDCTTHLFRSNLNEVHRTVPERHENDYLDIDTIAFLRQENYFPSSLLESSSDSLDDTDDDNDEIDDKIRNKDSNSIETDGTGGYNHNNKESQPLINPMNAMYDDRTALVRYYRTQRKFSQLTTNTKHTPPPEGYTNDLPITMDELIDADIRKEEQLQAWWDGKTSVSSLTDNNNNNDGTLNSNSSSGQKKNPAFYSKRTHTIDSLLRFQSENKYISVSSSSSPSSSLHHQNIPLSTVLRPNHEDDENDEDDVGMNENDYFDLPSRFRYQSPFSSLPQVFSPVTTSTTIMKDNDGKVPLSSSYPPENQKEDSLSLLLPITKNLSTLLDHEHNSSASLSISTPIPSAVGIPTNSIKNSAYFPSNTDGTDTLINTTTPSRHPFLTTSSSVNHKSYHRDIEKLQMMRSHSTEYNSPSASLSMHEISALPDLSILHLHSPVRQRRHFPTVGNATPVAEKKVYFHDKEEDIPLKLEHLENTPPNHHVSITKNQRFKGNSSYVTDPIDRSRINLSFSASSSSTGGVTTNTDPLPLSPLFAQQYARINAQLENLQRSYNGGSTRM